MQNYKGEFENTQTYATGPMVFDGWSFHALPSQADSKSGSEPVVHSQAMTVATRTTPKEKLAR